MINFLTVRVYGILIDPEKGLLVSDEYIQGKFYTKLPGGGLELEEGTRDCLKREFMEETGVAVTVGEHIYTTDYFQPSAFRDNQQFMGIYYFVQAKDTNAFHTHIKPFDFKPEQLSDPYGECESMRWVSLDQLSTDIFPLPTDKIAISLVMKKMQEDKASSL